MSLGRQLSEVCAGKCRSAAAGHGHENHAGGSSNGGTGSSHQGGGGSHDSSSYGGGGSSLSGGAGMLGAGGQGGTAFSNNIANNYGLSMGSLGMNCNTGQVAGLGIGYAGSGCNNESKEYSMFQNMHASSGIIVKDEEDLCDYASKFSDSRDTLPPVHVLGSANSLLGTNYLSNGQYDAESMMAEPVSGAVDPLQLTATLTFSGSSDCNVLLESLADDLLFHRMTSEEGLDSNNNTDTDILSTRQSNQNLSPSPGLRLQEPNVLPPFELPIDTFTEHCLNVMGIQRSNSTPYNFPTSNQFTKNPSAYLSSNNHYNTNHNNALLESLADDLLFHRMTSEEGLDSNNITDTDVLSTRQSNQNLSPSPGLRQQEPNVAPPAELPIDQFPEHCPNAMGIQRSYSTPHNLTTSNQFTKNPSAYMSSNNQHENTTTHNLPKEQPALALHIFSSSDQQTPSAQELDDPEAQMQQLQVQIRMQRHNQQPLLSPGLSFSGSGLDLVSPTAMSLPSPGGASCSMNGNGSMLPPGSIGSRRDSRNISSIPSRDVRISILRQRLGLPADFQFEFVNGGHGVKNPLANHDTPPGHRLHRKSETKKLPPATSSDDPSRFGCLICSKSFNLQRKLNRHMKCHSNIKRYLCITCIKGFNDTHDLKRHTRTHTGRRPFKCKHCKDSFTQLCSLESHCLRIHGIKQQYAHKERRAKIHICEDCDHTTSEPETHYLHLKQYHPDSQALNKFYDRRYFNFTNPNFTNMLLAPRRSNSNSNFLTNSN